MTVLKVTNKILSIGGRIIQIRNIAEADIVEDISGKKAGTNWIVGGVIVGSISIFALQGSQAWSGGPALGIILALFCVGLGIYLKRPLYLLLLQTNAGRITPLRSRDIGLLQSIIKNLHDAMSQEDVNYSIDISDSIIVDSQIGNLASGDVSKR